MANNIDAKKENQHDVETIKKIHKQNKILGYVILYLIVLLMIIIGEIILFKNDSDATLLGLFQDILGNLMGVLAAFLVFDIAHEKISKDAYATEVSQQILETMMYHPEVIDLYESSQKKVFINSFINSVVEDEDMTDMIENYLDSYLLTKKDYVEKSDITSRDCRIRTAFSYRFLLETERTKAFSVLKARNEDGTDPYFYVQEEFTYTVKFLSEKGKNLMSPIVRYGLVFDNKSLDQALRDGHKENPFEKCIFRENLEIDVIDRKYISSVSENEILKMFRPHVTIDGNKGCAVGVEIASDKNDVPFGIVFMFDVKYDIKLMQHDVNIIFHMPKKWDSIVEVCIVEPSKAPKISLSYNEDLMDIEMYSFLNKSDSSSYDNSLEENNGVFSISISNEWVFPVSGVAFLVKQKQNNVYGNIISEGS